jgi:hypothetical protein
VTEPVQAYPLQWPVGWRRAKPFERTDAKFHKGNNSRDRLNVGDGAARVYRELSAMGVREQTIVISSDLRLRLDGLPYADQPTSQLDPGVAVYWQKGKATRCMAVDRYRRLADNLAAIAATLEAMRAIERHGGAEILDRAFTGFTALPAPEQWFQVLGVPATCSSSDVEAAYKRLAMEHHPDRGGAHDQMARINLARDEGLAQAR